MSLFKIKCPGCGAENDKSARFCSKCGTRLDSKASKSICPSCNAELAPGANFCSKCGAKIGQVPYVERVGDASKEMGKNRQWVRKPSDFAQKFDVTELKGFFKKGVTVEQGTNALLIQGGAYKGRLDPGFYEIGSALLARLPVKFDERATIILVDSGEILLTFSVPESGLRARNDVKVMASGYMSAHIINPVAFLENYLKGEDHVSIKDIENRVSLTLQSIVQSVVATYTAEELYGNQNIIAKLETEFTTKLNTVLKSSGLEIIAIAYLGFDEGKWKEVRDAHEKLTLELAKEDLELERIQNESEFRMKKGGIETAETIDSIERKAAIAHAEIDNANKFEDERIARRHAGEEGEVRHRNKIDDINIDHKLANDDLVYEHNMKHHDMENERRIKDADVDAYEINTLAEIQRNRIKNLKMDELDIKERENKINLDAKERDLNIISNSERKRIENEDFERQSRSNASTKALLLEVDEKRSFLSEEIRKAAIEEKIDGVTDNTILAMQAGDSPEVAKIFQMREEAENQEAIASEFDKINREKYNDMKEILRENNNNMRDLYRENAKNMKENNDSALNAMGSTATARATAHNPGTTVVTGSGLGGNIVINSNSENQMRKCPKCGSDISQNDCYCDKCGEKL